MLKGVCSGPEIECLGGEGHEKNGLDGRRENAAVYYAAIYELVFFPR